MVEERGKEKLGRVIGVMYLEISEDWERRGAVWRSVL